MGLDTVELVISIEKIFGISIPDDVATGLDTVGKLHEFIVAELNRGKRPDINVDIVYEQLRTIICYRLGVDASAVVPEARFVQDLGAD